jgi:hypothetical protein
MFLAIVLVKTHKYQAIDKVLVRAFNLYVKC